MMPYADPVDNTMDLLLVLIISVGIGYCEPAEATWTARIKTSTREVLSTCSGTGANAERSVGTPAAGEEIVTATGDPPDRVLDHDDRVPRLVHDAASKTFIKRDAAELDKAKKEAKQRSAAGRRVAARLALEAAKLELIDDPTNVRLIAERDNCQAALDQAKKDEANP